MESSLPIHGLACPKTKIQTYNTGISTNQKKCGCKMKIKPLPAKEVTGTVIDNQTNKPFPAGLVNVYNTVTGKGTTAQADGSFTLSASPNDTIKISFVGYGTATLTGNQLPAKVTLKQQAEVLPEVVITANKPKKENWKWWVAGGVALLLLLSAKEDKESKKETPKA
ncbi:TonB-dependent receptor [Tenacibaculum sp. 190524A02b]